MFYSADPLRTYALETGSQVALRDYSEAVREKPRDRYREREISVSLSFSKNNNNKTPQVVGTSKDYC